MARSNPDVLQRSEFAPGSVVWDERCAHSLLVQPGLRLVFSFHPAFWAVPTAFLSESAAAASIGLINPLGSLGGFFGPWIMGYLVHRTRSFNAGLLYLVWATFGSRGR